MKRLILAAPLLALSACGIFGPPPVVSASASPCSSLIPEDWMNGVAGADLPEDDSAGSWIAFGDAQTGKLDQANGRTVDSIGIVQRCEARDRAAIEGATKGFFRRLLGN